MRASRRIRILLAVAIAPMPQALKRWAMLGLLGARMDRSATIGLSIVDCDALEMGPGSRIGHFTVLGACAAPIWDPARRWATSTGSRLHRCSDPR